ncbi:helix-turn-helix domain-containing protein [Paenibacillus lemnae]|uniref:Helix-turn-helix transcriptional regulator n=1 Tax=Paenibacillus lemnae TaxID=1330551 RepID=A0A848MAP9_PAELE|nr:helix-turn-helix domain-containing protein [Paenibacillus lemnae]NMO97626.1 helix-turn-helix transcriptional regulator [Paenibacillus lemnae]
MSLKKKWYKKTILSYLPTLYLTIAVIVLAAIFVVSEISLEEAKRTNHYSTKSIVDSLETPLKSVERRILEELRFGDALYYFFEWKGTGTNRLINFEANKSLRQLVTEYPVIHSIYLYRIKDGMVLSMNAFEPLKDFGDQAYIMSLAQQPSVGRSWSLPRIYKDSTGTEQQNVPVISLHKRTQLPMGNEGLIVINVSMNVLLKNIGQMIDPNTTYLHITAGEDQVVYTSPTPDRQAVMNTISSRYLQWKFESGIQSRVSFDSLQAISRIWIGLGVLCIVISFFYTLFITKRNYRPIENIIQQIQSFPDKRVAEKGLPTDEFSFIQKAIERLNDENMQYEAEVQEANQQKRKQWFLDILEHPDSFDEDKWQEISDRFGYPASFPFAAVTIIEIDHYAAFEEKYKKAYDQGLIKFAMSNVLHEYFHELSSLWPEWTRLNRMSVIHFAASAEQHEEWLARLEKFRVWVAVNLRLTVTIGLGEQAERWNELHRSYNEAVEALHFKMSRGSNRTLSYSETISQRSSNIHLYYQEMNALVHDFRLGHADWKERLQQLLSSLQHEVLTNEENLHLLHYFKSLLEQVLDQLPQPLQEQWKQQLLPEWDSLMSLEYMGDIVPRLLELLLGAYDSYLAHVQSKDTSLTIHSIRAFIEDNYNDPELSLHLISERFKLNSKYVSQLFKEQLGINFADFVMDLRIQHAKELLLSTNCSINEIAARVGYDIPLSFGRAFKKQVGVSPSDYRKNMAADTPRET